MLKKGMDLMISKLTKAVSLVLSAAVLPGILTCAATASGGDAKPRRTYSDLNDNVIITAFHPISYDELVNAEQFRLAADAGIDVMEYCGGMNVTDTATMKKAIRLAAEAGILCNMYDDRIQNNSLAMGKDAVFKIYDEYKGMAGLGGYYVLDEAVAPNTYADFINAVTEYDPDSTPFINNFPDIWGDGYYADRLSDLSHLIINRKNFVLSFDNYPFGAAAGSVDEYNLFKHFEAIRVAGNETDVRTGFYAQVIPYGYRKLNGSETLYHVNVALAYGCTEINYFAWGTPNEELCPGFGDAVIDRNGKPTPLYYDIIDINKYAHTIGTTLVKLRSEEVYHAGVKSDNSAYEKLPEEYFVQSDSYIIVSRMQNEQTGRDYLMIVNKQMNSEQTVKLTLTGADKLYEVSQTDGSTVEADGYENGVFTRKLKAGGAVLLALPEGISYGTPKALPSDGNLLEDAIVTASCSTGSDGWFVNRINDGICFSEDRRPGWQATGSKDGSEWLIFDLCEKKSFNRLDLYPAREGSMSGAYFPAGVTVSVSDDGESYKTVYTDDAIARPTYDVPVFPLGQVSGRYVRLQLEKSAGGICELAEVKLYNDTGKTPDPSKTLYEAEAIDSSVSVALGKPVVDYSTNYEHPEWNNSINYVTDGLYTTNWASDVLKTNSRDSVEYLTIDLGNTYDLERVVLHPMSGDGGYVDTAFPNSIEILVSENGEDFMTVATHDGGIEKPEPLELKFNAVKARYVKVSCTDLTRHPGALNCYMVQFSEVEVFAKADPETQAKLDLKKAIAKAQAADLNFYTAKSAAKLTAALEKALAAGTKEAGIKAATAELSAAYNALVSLVMSDNLALGKPVSSTSLYRAPEGMFANEFLTDGENPSVMTVFETHNGWCSDVYSDIKRDTAIDITVDLLDTQQVAAVFIAPMRSDASFFPTSYLIQTSVDGEGWQTVGVADNIENVSPDDIFKYKVDNVLARYVRVHITKNSPKTAGTPAYVSQLGEIEIYGAAEQPIETEAATTDVADTSQPDTTGNIQTHDTTASAPQSPEEPSVSPFLIAGAVVAALAVVAAAVFIVVRRRK